MTGVSAVVVRWKGGDEVKRCLESLLEHGRPQLREVVLVDSGSGDGGAERLAAAFAQVRVLALESNRSFAFAAGRGAEATGQPLLLLVNPDAQLLPGALDLLTAFLEEHPHAAGAVPLLGHPGGGSQHRWQLRRLPTASRLALGRGGAAAFSRAPRLPAPVEQPAAAAWLVRRPVWEALDGLDPAFAPAWWEDVDWCARLESRLAAGGLHVTSGFWVVPGARMLHLGGSSLASLDQGRFLEIYSRNLIRYAARHHGRHLALIATGVRLSLVLRGLLRPSRRAAYLAAARAVARVRREGVEVGDRGEGP